MKAKWLYRLESADPRNGLWYNANGEFCWGIAEVPGCRTKDLPMDYDERYKKDGRDWFSACSNAEDLPHWYSLDDVKHLLALGFVFKKYLATEYVEYELETTFIKESCLDSQELSLYEIAEIMDRYCVNDI